MSSMEAGPAGAELRRGDQCVLEIDAMAHGGRGIAHLDGRVVFVPRAYPGDRVCATITKVKKRWALARIDDIAAAGAYRGPHRCEAAASGAGCCDFSTVREDRELALKLEVLRGQLRRVTGQYSALDGADPESDAAAKSDAAAGAGEEAVIGRITATALRPTRGWRTRVRLGVDRAGRAGVRRARSTDIVAGRVCSQWAPGLAKGIVSPAPGAADAPHFTPGSELVALLDGEGHRHVVELNRPARGRRAENVERVLEGGLVTQHVFGATFTFPPTAFWQAHSAASACYAETVARLLRAGGAQDQDDSSPIGWDLYGGVGLFVPVLASVLGEGGVNPEIHTVDSSAPAARSSFGEAAAGAEVVRHVGRVEKTLVDLPRPRAVVLDPPRAGAGDEVIAAIAATRPRVVVHVGCDPATLARDLGSWVSRGYRVPEIELIDAFPATHHFESIALIVPR